MQADGSWAIDATLPKAGYYKLIADFLPLGGTPQMIPWLLAAGDAGDLASARAHLPSDDGLEKTAGSMDVACHYRPMGSWPAVTRRCIITSSMRKPADPSPISSRILQRSATRWC
jgi:hypothetical protein